MYYCSGFLTFQIANGSESSGKKSRSLPSGSVGGLVFASSITGMPAPSNQLLAGDIPELEGGLNGTRVDWFEKLPRLLTMLIGRLEDFWKLPTLLTGRVEGSVASAGASTKYRIKVTNVVDPGSQDYSPCVARW